MTITASSSLLIKAITVKTQFTTNMNPDNIIVVELVKLSEIIDKLAI